MANEREQRMKIINVTLIGACLACLPVVNSSANDSLPFAILSASSNAAAKHRALPDFSLVERSGKKITLADLRGKVWIADFIYTHCPDTCPMQTADMAKLQDRWMKEDDLKLVSFSVDPERDTPRVILEYAKRFKADANRWLFLTGGKKEIASLVEKGFRLPLASAAHGDHGVVVHSPRFVLIDRLGRVRGYYDNRDPKAVQRLVDDVTRLLQNSTLARDLPRTDALTPRSGIRRHSELIGLSGGITVDSKSPLRR